MLNIFHPFHLVTNSPWPVISGFGGLGLTSRIIFIFKFNKRIFLIVSCFLLVSFSFFWWRDVSREAVLLGDHSSKVQDGLKWGIFLFIFSEILFFMAWFWSFFHNSLAPVQEIGLIWPPTLISPLDPFSVPLLNTAILLSSGVRVTWAHHNIQNNKKILLPIIITLFLGIIFTLFQVFEYVNRTFSISDSVFGTNFFVSTGFHGLHVLIGTLFLFFCVFRSINIEFVSIHHLGFEFAIWYWHFVDVVWLFLFSFIYWWGFFFVFSLKKIIIL